MSKQGDQLEVSRRKTLKFGAVATGGFALGGLGLTSLPLGGVRSSASSEERTIVSEVHRHGHYGWFPVGPDTWGRSSNPVEMSDGDMRWEVKPTADGGVRSLVENLPANRNAGVDIHLGPLSELEEITVTAETLQTARGTGPANMFVGLYLDVDDNGEFFEWESESAATDSWVGFGGDDEGLIFRSGHGEITIDDTFTEFLIFHAEQHASISDLRAGVIEGIDGSTSAALYTGVASTGEGTEEVVIKDVSVKRN